MVLRRCENFMTEMCTISFLNRNVVKTTISQRQIATVIRLQGSTISDRVFEEFVPRSNKDHRSTLLKDSR